MRLYACKYVCHCHHHHHPVISTSSTLAVSQFNYIGTGRWAVPSMFTRSVQSVHYPHCVLEVYTAPIMFTYSVPSMYTINNTVPSMQSWVNTEFTAQKHNTMGCHHHNATTDQHRVCPVHHHDHLHQQQCPACHHHLPCPAPAAG